METDLTTLKTRGNKDKKKTDPGEQKWTPEQEELLAEWSEKATCYRWLHSRSEKRYRCRNYTFTIPVIILSTLTGTANFAMDSFVPDSHKQVAMACVGSVNIFAGILSTLQNFLRYAELMESHRLSEVQWSKFGRNISVELALNPKRRKPANDFLKVCRAEYDRLIEQSPTIDDPIVKQFKSSFKNIDVNTPDMCNGIKKCKIFIPSEEDKKIDMIAEVGSKLIKKSHHKIWKPVEPVNSNSPKIAEVVSKKTDDSKKELEGLMNMGKVSSFKKVKVSGEPKNENPMNTIHEIVKLKQNQDHEEDTSEDKNKEIIKDKDIELGIKEDEILDEKEQLFLDGIEDTTELLKDNNEEIINKETGEDKEDKEGGDNEGDNEEVKCDGCGEVTNLCDNCDKNKKD